MPLDSQKITADGLYELTAEEYHSDICAGPSISSTGLRTIHSEGLEAYWATAPENPRRWPSEERGAFRIGEAAHLFLLEPERVERRIAVAPYDDFRKKEAREWRDEAVEAGKLVVTSAEFRMLGDMRDALAALPEVRGALSAGRAEQSLIWQDKATGAWLKARPDFLPNAKGRFIVDYKTSASLDRWADKALLDFRYDIQAWLQIEGARLLCDVEPIGVLYIVQSKKPPYSVRLRHLMIGDLWSDAALARGQRDGRAALERFAEASRTGDWRDRHDFMRPLIASEEAEGAASGRARAIVDKESANV